MLTRQLQIFSDQLSLGAIINFIPDYIPEITLYIQKETGKSTNVLEITLKDFEQHECFTRFVAARVAESLHRTDPTPAYQDILHELTGKRYDLDDTEKREFVQFIKAIGWVIGAHKTNKLPTHL